MGTWLPTQAVTMKSFVLSSLFAVGLSAPTTHVNSGLPAGPLTPAFGDAVQTPKGLRSLALEGFSEDLNQDGFVDPIGQAVVAAPVAYTVPHVVSHPVAAVNTAVAPVAVKAAEPVEVKSVPAVAPVTYTVPQVYTHSVSSVGVPAVQYVANYAPLTHFVSGIPVAAAPAAAAAAPVAEEAAGVEVA